MLKSEQRSNDMLPFDASQDVQDQSEEYDPDDTYQVDWDALSKGEGTMKCPKCGRSTIDIRVYATWDRKKNTRAKLYVHNRDVSFGKIVPMVNITDSCLVVKEK